MGQNEPLTVWQTAALKCLEFAQRRDAVKGGSGTRDTKEVAEYVGITTDQARAVLNALSSAGLVDRYDEFPLEWKITEAGVKRLTSEAR